MYKLDYNKKITIQLSNDAFFYLKDGEELIDDANADEVAEIIAMFEFENGYYIEDSWQYVNDSDLIEATFVPYVEEQWDFDEYIDLFNGWQLQIKWLNTELVRARLYNPTKEPLNEQEYAVAFMNGRPYINMGKSIFPLWKNTKKQSRTN